MGAWLSAGLTIGVSTDDAYVDGIVSPVGARVSGHIVGRLPVNPTTPPVRAGDVLLRGGPAVTSRPGATRRAHRRRGVAEAQRAGRRAELPLTRDTTRARRWTRSGAALEGSRVSVRASESAVDEARARRWTPGGRLDGAAMTDVAASRSAQRKAARDLERMQLLMKNDWRPGETTMTP